MTHTCQTCRTEIPNGLAHFRSVSFTKLAFCGPCLDLERAAVTPTAAPIPAQRRGGSLSERLAVAERERLSA